MKKLIYGLKIQIIYSITSFAKTSHRLAFANIRYFIITFTSNAIILLSIFNTYIFHITTNTIIPVAENIRKKMYNLLYSPR